MPIPGTRRLTRVEENAGSTAVALSADERADLDHLTDEVGVAGKRYSARAAGVAVIFGRGWPRSPVRGQRPSTADSRVPLRPLLSWALGTPGREASAGH